MGRRNKLARRIAAIEHNIEALQSMLWHRDNWLNEMQLDIDVLFDDTITPDQRARIAEARLRARITD